jgi:hypothetical protein
VALARRCEFPDVILVSVLSQLLYMLVSDSEPQYTAGRLIIYFGVPLLTLAASCFLLPRKRNWIDYLAVLFALIWLIYKGVLFTADMVSEHAFEGDIGNVFAVIWFLGYITYRRALGGYLKRSYVGQLIIGAVVSLVLYILYSIAYMIIADAILFSSVI